MERMVQKIPTGSLQGLRISPYGGFNSFPNIASSPTSFLRIQRAGSPLKPIIQEIDNIPELHRRKARKAGRAAKSNG